MSCTVYFCVVQFSYQHKNDWPVYSLSRLYSAYSRVHMTRRTPALYLILGDLNRRDHHRLDGRVARAGRRALDRVDDVLALDDLAEDRVL